MVFTYNTTLYPYYSLSQSFMQALHLNCVDICLTSCYRNHDTKKQAEMTLSLFPSS